MRTNSLVAALVAACALLAPSLATATPCPTDLPVLFLVQDKSGSMGDAPDPSCGSCASKWDSSTTAVTDLTTKFSNRFSFGLEFFPPDSSSCSPGTVVASVPSSASTIHNAYYNAAPGGSTPTAVSLDSANTYLKGLNLKVNAYVMLITDGLPNCNGALDPNTCQWSSTSCDPSSCSAGDCLDDVATKAAAARLKAAGFPVYVVGFGATAQSNQAVLDGIAAAGGTTHAYTATDEASLSSQMDTIAAQVANCCKDACIQGAQQCDPNGNSLKCVFDAAQGCTVWNMTACGYRTTCQNGNCVACSDACTLNSATCDGNTVSKCVTGANGCTDWSKVQDCGWGELCAGAACTSCADCTLGDKRCAGGNQYQTCTLDWLRGLGCTTWTSGTCAAGQVCTGTDCARCDLVCTKGAGSCSGKTPITCVADQYGCTSWSTGTPCTDFCSGGQCGKCGTACTPGQNQCDGPKLGVCTLDANACPVLTDQDCPANQTCRNNACAPCPDGCTPGDKICSGDNIMECTQQASGCYGMTQTAACNSGEVCTDGVCHQPCTNDCTEGDTKCGGTVPYNCVKAATGCTVWQAGTACPKPKICAKGGCRDECLGGEIETCTAGFVCTVLPEGHVCLPDATKQGDAGTNPTGPKDASILILGDDDAGTKPVAKKDGGGTSSQDPGTGAGGCGCNAGASGAMALLPVLLLFSLRRRRQ